MNCENCGVKVHDGWKPELNNTDASVAVTYAIESKVNGVTEYRIEGVMCQECANQGLPDFRFDIHKWRIDNPVCTVRI